MILPRDLGYEPDPDDEGWSSVHSREANLRKADLSQANLSQANLRGRY